MPTGIPARSSTADGTSGTQVAQAASEVSGSGILQSVVIEGNKSTYAEVSRTGLTVADAPTGGNLTTTGFAGAAGANLVDLGNALTMAVRATCSVAGAILSGFIVLYDASNNPIGKSEVITFVSDATLRLGNATGDFICQRVLIDCGQGRKCRFFVSSISGGTWAVYKRPI